MNFWLTATLVIATLSLRCGTPGGPDDGFTFTPVPVYTTTAGFSVYFDAECRAYDSDSLYVLVPESELARAKQLLDEAGFRVERDPPPVSGMTGLLIQVPEGAVPDAVIYLKNSEIFEVVEESSIGGFPEATPQWTCTPSRRIA